MEEEEKNNGEGCRTRRRRQESTQRKRKSLARNDMVFERVVLGREEGVDSEALADSLADLRFRHYTGFLDLDLLRRRSYFSEIRPWEKDLFSRRRKRRSGKALGKSGMPSPISLGTTPR
jgi:hypothetical protein